MFAYPKVIAPGKVSQDIKSTVFHPRETDRKFNTRGRPAPCSRLNVALRRFDQINPLRQRRTEHLLRGAYDGEQDPSRFVVGR